MAILTYAIMQNYKPCSINNMAKITQLIEEVEFLEISKLVGKDTYKQLVEDCATSPIATDVQNILNKGLYKCISYFVYSQYIINSSITDTFTGMVQKTRQDSESVPIGTLKNEQNRYREIALMAFEDVRELIETKYDNDAPNRTKQRVTIHNIKRVNHNVTRNMFDANYFE